MWFCEHRGGDAGMPHLDESIKDTLDRIRACPSRWNKLLIRSRNATASYLSVTGIAQVWHREFLEQCDLFCFPRPIACADRAEDGDGDPSFFKRWCGFVAQGFASFAVRSTHQHGFRQPEYTPPV